MISGFEGDLSGLLSYQAHYRKIKKMYGEGFTESVAGDLMRVIDREVERHLDEIKISACYRVLSVKFKHWRFIQKH